MWQLDVAAGLPLPLAQDAIELRGHAIEARVYAEDPYSGFLPQSGAIEELIWSADARVDAAYDAPGEVTTAYDPMIAKLIVHGADREAARLLMLDALDESAVFGVKTNLGFVRRLVSSTQFSEGAIDTGWLDSDAAEALLDGARAASRSPARRCRCHRQRPGRPDRVAVRDRRRLAALRCTSTARGSCHGR